jgi:3-methyl-2-oxobutanoate hydroxymethyltransferase
MSSTEKFPAQTVPGIRALKGKRPIAAVTAYDFTFASLIDRADIDLVLVGDSLGMVIQGLSSTLPVTLEEMIYHTKAVARGTTRALLVSDLPFLSYQTDLPTAIRSAGALLKDGGAAAVKCEGGVHIADTVKRLVDLDIPVMGHVGMTPQSVHRMGGFKVQGREHRSGGALQAGSWEQIMDDALAIAQAGAFSLVIECVPAELAREITQAVSIPTIGIGAGPHCDGQILVSYDVLGLTTGRIPSFVGQPGNLGSAAVEILRNYSADVRSGAFPHSPATSVVAARKRAARKPKRR